MAQYSLGIDIGGTFTDLVVYDHDAGRRWSHKVLTTHDDPARAVAAGVAALLTHAPVDPAAVSRTVHATTLFTNVRVLDGSRIGRDVEVVALRHTRLERFTLQPTERPKFRPRPAKGP